MAISTEKKGSNLGKLLLTIETVLYLCTFCTYLLKSRPHMLF